LLRVFNDKRAFKEPFPALSSVAAADSAQSLGATAESGLMANIVSNGSTANSAGKSRVLVIKHSASRNMTAFDRNRQHSKPPPSAINNDFPALVSRPLPSQTAPLQPLQTSSQQQKEEGSMVAAQSTGTSTATGGDGKKSKKQKAQLLMSTSLKINSANASGLPFEAVSGTVRGVATTTASAKLVDFSKLALSEPSQPEEQQQQNSKFNDRDLSQSTEFPALPSAARRPTSGFSASNRQPTANGDNSTSKKSKRVVLRFG
jgi:hypothetical protein